MVPQMLVHMMARDDSFVFPADASLEIRLFFSRVRVLLFEPRRWRNYAVPRVPCILRAGASTKPIGSIWGCETKPNIIVDNSNDAYWTPIQVGPSQPRSIRRWYSCFFLLGPTYPPPSFECPNLFSRRVQRKRLRSPAANSNSNSSPFPSPTFPFLPFRKLIDVEGTKFRVLLGTSPEEVAIWRAERRKRWPTEANIARSVGRT